MEDNTEWATIGTIVAPFGIRGELKVHLSTDVPDRFSTLKAVYLSGDLSRRKIKDVRPYKGEMILLKLEGINDATAAESLRNRELYIPASELAQLPPDSYYQHDILGLRVLKLDGSEVGTITGIIPTGSNDVYVVKATSGQQYLIPAIKDVVKQIDLARSVMLIQPMPGLLDEEATADDQPEQREKRADRSSGTAKTHRAGKASRAGGNEEELPERS